MTYHLLQQQMAAQAAAMQAAAVTQPHTDVYSAQTRENAARQEHVDAIREQMRAAGITCQFVVEEAVYHSGGDDKRQPSRVRGRVKKCGFDAAGRCPNCDRAFCDSHRGYWGNPPHTIQAYLDICAECRALEIAAARRDRHR